ncbi:hypothetical protein, partial [uncultured Brevundimonas sp.]|uniref:hypothetical protein n=1 Tax=uncultured Brevundimonas sp. TaxID=213418 RepID=UPI002601F8B4
PPASMTRVNQPPPSEAIADFFNGIGAKRTYISNRSSDADDIGASLMFPSQPFRSARLLTDHQ